MVRNNNLLIVDDYYGLIDNPPVMSVITANQIMIPNNHIYIVTNHFMIRYKYILIVDDIYMIHLLSVRRVIVANHNMICNT